MRPTRKEVAVALMVTQHPRLFFGSKVRQRADVAPFFIIRQHSQTRNEAALNRLKRLSFGGSVSEPTMKKNFSGTAGVVSAGVITLSVLLLTVSPASSATVTRDLSSAVLTGGVSLIAGGSMFDPNTAGQTVVNGGTGKSGGQIWGVAVASNVSAI